MKGVILVFAGQQINPSCKLLLACFNFFTSHFLRKKRFFYIFPFCDFLNKILFFKKILFLYWNYSISFLACVRMCDLIFFLSISSHPVKTRLLISKTILTLNATASKKYGNNDRIHFSSFWQNSSSSSSECVKLNTQLTC